MRIVHGDVPKRSPTEPVNMLWNHTAAVLLPNWRPYGITVNIVSPGPVQSGYITPEMEEALIPEIPIRRVGLPEDIANAVAFLSSEESKYITGQVLVVDGGIRI